MSHFIADEAYDGDPTSGLLVKLFGVAVEITIPPPKAVDIISAVAQKRKRAAGRWSSALN